MLLRGIRWRLGPSLLMVLIAAIAVGAAVLGPLYLRAAGDSLVRSSVAAAPVQSAGMTLTPIGNNVVPLNSMRAEQRVLTQRFDLDYWYGSGITTVSTAIGMTGPGAQPFGGQMLYRSGICGHITMRVGHCQLVGDQILVSQRTAQAMKIGVGSGVSISVRGASRPRHLQVTGIYAVPALGASYWWGSGPGYFAYGTPGQGHEPNMDAFITTEATALNVPLRDAPAVTIQLPLRANVVGLQNRDQIQQLLTGAAHAARPNNIAVTSGIPLVLAASAAQQHQMTTIVAIAAIQLVLLAIWVLTALLLRGIDLRRSELRMARLRGFTFVSLLAVTVVEPAILCLAGAVIGVACAWIAILIAKDALLYPTATMSVGVWVIAALAAVLLTIFGVLFASAVRAVRTPASNQVNAAPSKVTDRGVLLADGAMLMLSVVALVALATSGALAAHSNPIASAAPALLALGVAVIAVRLVLLVCRRLIPAADRSGSVAGVLAFRQVTRRPVVVRQGRVLIVALCLACFATSAWAVARSNRQTAAHFSVGASTVVDVTPGAVPLQQAVRRVDPQGRYAMAAVQIKTASAHLVAVDAQQLSAVASWPDGITHLSSRQISRLLQPPTAPQVNLPPTPISMNVTAAAGRADAKLSGLELAVWVFNQQQGTTIVPMGALRSGSHRYRGSLGYWCPGGCRLSGVGLVPRSNRPVPSSGTIDFSVERIAALPTGRTLPADLDAGGWRSSASGVQVQATPGRGVTFAVPAGVLANYQGGVLGSITPPMASVADHPLNLPGVVTQTALAGGSRSGAITTVSSQGIDGNTVSIAAVAASTALPRVGDDAELVDLTMLTRAQVNPQLSEAATDEVWLAADAPANTISRLRAAGLKINAVERSQQVYAGLQHSGSAFAYDFMLFATIVALMVAAASTLGVLGSAVRQRAAEMTALRVAGVDRRRIVRSLVLESAILAFTALFGVVAGVVGAALAIPSLPELSKALESPLSYALPAPLIILVAACTVALVALVTALTGAEILRRMSPTILRTAPNDTGG